MNDHFPMLALDAAYGTISACILSAETVHLSVPDINPESKTRSSKILPMLDALLRQAGLQWRDLKALAFSQGPGSFTGLRIAAATLAGINTGLKLPILHISSLAITAAQADSPDPVRVIEDARAGEAFIGYYHQGKALQADACLSWQAVAALPAADFISLNPVQKPLAGQQLSLQLGRSEALARSLNTAIANTANGSALPRFPSPVYLQLSQAEKNLHG